mmetsp:Transcript_95034/g.306864  ORF Transcript_95034/g.306864 Transcript_95034/m.306864 type:complete len:176 (+) Transcript_95034:195-722(+)
MDCDIRFIAAEAQAAKAKQLGEEMQAAAQAMDFEKAQELKLQLSALQRAAAPEANPPETWLLREAEFPAFGRFLASRGLGPQDVEISCEQEANGPSAWGSRACQECSRLHSGGPYGAVGVVSPAFPPQESAAGCLAQSQALDVDLSSYDALGDDALGDTSYDASQSPATAAFCRA